MHLCVVLILKYARFTVSRIQFQALAPKELVQNIDFEHSKKRVLLYYFYSVSSLAAEPCKDRLYVTVTTKKFIPSVAEA